MTDPRELLDGSHFDHAIGPNAMRWAPEPIPIHEESPEDPAERISRLLGHATRPNPERRPVTVRPPIPDGGHRPHLVIVDEASRWPHTPNANLHIARDGAVSINPARLTQEDVDRAGEQYAHALRPVFEGLAEIARRVGEALAFTPARPTEDRPPADPRERALWAKARRGTGPAPRGRRG